MPRNDDSRGAGKAAARYLATKTEVGMSEIEELNSRIMAAMDRVAQGIDKLDAGDTEQLRQALDEEKQVNAQLTERVRVLGERQEQAIEALETRANEAQERVSALDEEMQKLRKANRRLTKICNALRQANEEGVGEPHLINKSMMVELESIRAMRGAEIAEAEEIIAALTPLLQKAGADTEEAH